MDFVVIFIYRSSETLRNLDREGVGGIVLVVAAVLIFIFLKKIIVNSILGVAAWAILTFVFHVELPFIPSLAVSIIFGLAGIGAMLVLRFFGIV